MELKLTKNSKTSFAKNQFNTFGLMYGDDETGGTCPGATRGPGGCLAVREGRTRQTCYMAKLTAIYGNVKKVLQSNTELVRNASYDEKIQILRNTMVTFRKKAKEKLYFRLHYSGDFFSREYAEAWAVVIKENPDIQFWAYTRSVFYDEPLKIVYPLLGIPNLTLYFSIDPVNHEYVTEVYNGLKGKFNNLGLAWMDDKSAPTTENKFITCPETSGKITSDEIGACAKCRLCVDNFKVRVKNITFKIH